MTTLLTESRNAQPPKLPLRLFPVGAHIIAPGPAEYI